MLFFYVFLSSITPLAGASVIPTGSVINDPESMKEYVTQLPKSIMVFISLEIVGIILGMVGYKIIVDSTPKRYEYE